MNVNEEEHPLDLSVISSDVQRKILEKFDFHTYAIFDETSQLTHHICEKNHSLFFPLTTGKINFIEGIKSPIGDGENSFDFQLNAFTLRQANEGRAKLVAEVCALPVNNPDFEDNYAALLKNRSKIDLLLLRGQLRNMTVELFDKLLKTLVVPKVGLEGQMGENLMKSNEIHKLRKFVLNRYTVVTDVVLQEMNAKGPYELKLERTTFTEQGIANFIKEFMRGKRALNIVTFPKIWQNLDLLKGKLLGYHIRDITTEEVTTIQLFQHIIRSSRKEIGILEIEPGFVCFNAQKQVIVMQSSDNHVFMQFNNT